VVWAYTGDERRGSKAAVLVGRATGYVLIGFGLAVSLLGDPLNSVLLVVSGWFLGSAARGLDRRAAIEDLLEGLRVDEVMERDTPSVTPQLTLDTFAGQYLDRADASSLAVMRGDSLLGLIGVSDLRRIARRRWPTTPRTNLRRRRRERSPVVRGVAGSNPRDDRGTCVHGTGGGGRRAGPRARRAGDQRDGPAPVGQQRDGRLCDSVG